MAYFGVKQYDEDAAHSSGDKGIVALVVRKDAAAQGAGTDGDYTVLITDANGRLHVLDANSADIKTAVEAIQSGQLADGHNVTVDNAGGLEVVQDTAADFNVTEANSAAIKTAVELLDNAIDGTEMQVDVVASLPAGTNAIGKLAANSGVDIGDVDVTSVPSAIQGDGNPTIDSYGHKAINLTTGANQVLVSSAASKQVWVYGFGLTCGDAAAQSISLQDEDDTALTGIMEFAQYGGISVPPSGNFSMPLFKLGTDKDLEIDITGGDVDGFLTYAIVSV
ncbi:MAG: hypothetical protein U9O94_01415 [Nanoarchaeota archaeon]|nr:hypothetical protein [Nanoarchaeota archaeon]